MRRDVPAAAPHPSAPPTSDRATPATAATAATAATSLRLASPVRPAGGRAPVARGPFVAAVLAVLGVGLLGLLLLNTALAQGSFHLHALQVSGKQLADREQDLQQDVDARQAPAALAAQAQAQGMVPGGPPVFLELPSGKVLGEPTPAPTPAAAPLPPAVDVPRDDASPSPAVTDTAKTASPKTASPKTAGTKAATTKTATTKTASAGPTPGAAR